MDLFKSKQTLSKTDRKMNLYKSVGDFRSIIERERARADRTNQKFTLIIFEVGFNNKYDFSLIMELFELINTRIRITDEVGWFSVKSIGALLTDTDEEGAYKFIEDLKNKFSSESQFPPYIIYIYPSINWQKDLE